MVDRGESFSSWRDTATIVLPGHGVMIIHIYGSRLCDTDRCEAKLLYIVPAHSPPWLDFWLRRESIQRPCQQFTRISGSPAASLAYYYIVPDHLLRGQEQTVSVCVAALVWARAPVQDARDLRAARVKSSYKYCMRI